MKKRAVISVALLAGLAWATTTAAQEDADLLPEGGLGRDLVAGYCGVCHSLKFVMQQGLSRARWDRALTTMVELQGMTPLEPADREQVLDYLFKWYGPDRAALSRRPKPE